MTAVLWSEAEQKAWAAPATVTVTENAEAHRWLDEKSNAEPGPFRVARTPYLRMPMDCMGDPDIDLVVIKKPAQVGFSEATRCAIHYWAKCDPGPCLVVFPDEDSVKANVEERIRPMVKADLKEEVTERASDLKITKLSLTTMDIYAGWAGSPQKLATRPVRYVIMDETNKYKGWVGKEGSPIGLAKARTRTWKHRAKCVLLSTPTVAGGHISKAYDECQRRYKAWVACPSCHGWQVMVWARVIWPERGEGEDRLTHATRIETEQLARYSCIHCDAKWNEPQRKRAIRAVEWRLVDGSAETGRSVGFHMSVLVNAWCNMSALAAKFLRCKDTPEELQEFINQELGEDFEDRLSAVPDGRITEKAKENHPRFEVPAWAGHVLIGVDSQKLGFWYGVRAFGRDNKSRLIDHGFVTEFADLDLLLKTHYPIQGTSYTIEPTMLTIDAGGGKAASIDGSRTDQVYRWSRTDPRIKPVLGRDVKDTAGLPIKPTASSYGPEGKKYKIVRYLLNADHFKDMVSAWIDNPDDNLWQVHKDICNDYKRQMTSEHKVLARIGNQMRYKWTTKSEGADNHLWDVEVYLAAAATIAQSALLPDERTLIRQRHEIADAQSEQLKRQSRPERNQDDWIGNTGGWL